MRCLHSIAGRESSESSIKARVRRVCMCVPVLDEVKLPTITPTTSTSTSTHKHKRPNLPGGPTLGGALNDQFTHQVLDLGTGRSSIRKCRGMMYKERSLREHDANERGNHGRQRR